MGPLIPLQYVDGTNCEYRIKNVKSDSAFSLAQKKREKDNDYDVRKDEDHIWREFKHQGTMLGTREDTVRRTPRKGYKR